MGFNSGFKGLKFFFSPKRTDRLWGPPRLVFNWFQRFFSLGAKLPGRDADHSPQSTAKVKNSGSYSRS